MPRVAVDSTIPIADWFSELATHDLIRRAMRDLKERCVLVMPESQLREFSAHLSDPATTATQKNNGRLIQAAIDECIRVDYFDKKRIMFSIAEPKVGFDALVETLWSDRFEKCFSQRIKQPYLQRSTVGGMPSYESPADACERIFGEISSLVTRIEILDAWAGNKFIEAVGGVPNGLSTFMNVALKGYKGELIFHTRVGGKRDPATDVLQSELQALESAVSAYPSSKIANSGRLTLRCYVDMADHSYNFPHDRMLRIEFRGGKSVVFALGHGTELFSNKRNEPNVKLFSELHDGNMSWKVALLSLKDKIIQDF